MMAEGDAKRRRGATSKNAINRISENRIGQSRRARSWSIGSIDSNNGYESSSNFCSGDLVRVRRVFMAMSKEDAYRALPLVSIVCWTVA